MPRNAAYPRNLAENVIAGFYPFLNRYRFRIADVEYPLYGSFFRKNFRKPAHIFDMEKLKRLLTFGKQEADKEIELVLTGRSAQVFLSDMADYVTEMECVSHPYEKGIGARKGIEF